PQESARQKSIVQATQLAEALPTYAAGRAGLHVWRRRPRRRRFRKFWPRKFRNPQAARTSPRGGFLAGQLGGMGGRRRVSTATGSRPRADFFRLMSSRGKYTPRVPRQQERA